MFTECGGSSSSITHLRPGSFVDVRPSQVIRYELFFQGLEQILRVYHHRIE